MTSYIWYWLFPSYYAQSVNNVENKSETIEEKNSDSNSNSDPIPIPTSNSDEIPLPTFIKIDPPPQNPMLNAIEINKNIEQKIIKPAAGRNNPGFNISQMPRCMVTTTEDELRSVMNKLKHIEVPQNDGPNVKVFESALSKALREHHLNIDNRRVVYV